MMEKDFNEQQLDRLIQDWTDEKLPQDIDNHITESLLNFVDNDDNEIDVDELIDFHIHQLAIEGKMTKRRKWKIFVSSVAAASVAVLIVSAIFISQPKLDSHSDMGTLIVAENKSDDDPIVINRDIPEIIADSTNMILAKASIKGHTEGATNSKRKRSQASTAVKQKEDLTEQKLVETIAEINAGLDNMVYNAKESMKMTNVSFLPENLFSDINEYDSFESISDEYSSTPHSEQMQKLTIIETNLINALYEIRSLNVDLNFNTDNITTEI